LIFYVSDVWHFIQHHFTFWTKNYSHDSIGSTFWRNNLGGWVRIPVLIDNFEIGTDRKLHNRHFNSKSLLWWWKSKESCEVKIKAKGWGEIEHELLDLGGWIRIPVLTDNFKIGTDRKLQNRNYSSGQFEIVAMVMKKQGIMRSENKGIMWKVNNTRSQDKTKNPSAWNVLCLSQFSTLTYYLHMLS